MPELKQLAEIRFIPPVYFLLAVMPGLILQWLYPLDILNHPFVKGAGAMLMLLSLLLAIWAGITLKKAGTHIHIRHPTLTLVTHGPYQYSRNPMYLSLLLVITGLGLYYGALWVLACIPLIIFIVNNRVIQIEEQHLENLFGDNYAYYKANSRRWI